jgi:hypothetical protein
MDHRYLDLGGQHLRHVHCMPLQTAPALLRALTLLQWIPAHMAKPPSQTYVEINKYWDRISKIIICLVDAGLNWYFMQLLI